MVAAYNDDDHSEGGLSPDKPGTAGQNDNRDGDRDDGKIELGIVLVRRNHDQELNGEAEEKEEVELQQGDVNLEIRVRRAQ